MYQVAYARMLKFVKIYLVQKSIKNFDKLPEFVKEEQRKKKNLQVGPRVSVRNGLLKCLH